MLIKTTDIPKGNAFFVGAQGDGIVFLRPVPQRLTKEEASNLAVWILAMTCPDALSEEGFSATDSAE